MSLLLRLCKLSVDLFMCNGFCVFFFCKQKTAYEMRISDWSSDVCSSDLPDAKPDLLFARKERPVARRHRGTAKSRGGPDGYTGQRSAERRVGERVCQYVSI